jgi:hypothetical protein
MPITYLKSVDFMQMPFKTVCNSIQGILLLVQEIPLK